MTAEFFQQGFNQGFNLWRDGLTTESIREQSAGHAEAYAAGMVAACDAIMGWQDCAERAARRYGFTRFLYDLERAQ